MQLFQIYYYVPESHLEVTKKAIFAAGAGVLGYYCNCSWETLGQGQYCPLAGSDPYHGKIDTLEKVREYKVETVCTKQNLTKVIAALKASHPYEELAYGIIELKNTSVK
ncbi:MAG: NGG1p interacting factor NIF3 [Gammaproteobacteria bacterium]|nr:NGG1p interacting factor NIF3 [Gammaproteobacteria bacterium]